MLQLDGECKELRVCMCLSLLSSLLDLVLVLLVGFKENLPCMIYASMVNEDIRK